MIDTEARGQEKWAEVIAAIDTFDWTDYEHQFIRDRRHRTYANLTDKQQSMVGRLWEKLRGV